ncbi:MAG: hypothetical protein IJC50_04465 [Clostridia bacterium]|nr:hypothetical protein [Clostridia bacterium]
MKYLNIIYEECYDDADIICVPDSIYDNIKEIVTQFLNWLPDAPKTDPDYWWLREDGNYGQILETVGFIKWLNNTHCQNEGNAFIVKQNTNWDPEFGRIDW